MAFVYFSDRTITDQQYTRNLGQIVVLGLPIGDVFGVSEMIFW